MEKKNLPYQDAIVKEVSRAGKYCHRLTSFKLLFINLVPRAFPSKNGWPLPCFERKALGTRLSVYLTIFTLDAIFRWCRNVNRDLTISATTTNFSPLIQLVQSFKSREMKADVKGEDRLAVHVLKRTTRLVISRVRYAVTA